ncbi:MAG: hypothetical protein ACLQQ4_00735 [Bacteroidia bacterium]
MERETNEFFQKSDVFFASLMKHRKALFIISLSAAIVSGIVSLIIPAKYKSSTVLFTSITNNTSRSLIEQNYETRDYIAFGDDKNCEQMLQVIKSADVMYAMERRFHLLEHYKLTKDQDKDFMLRAEYNDNFEFEITEYQSIKITVFDKSPELAYEYASGIVKVADSVYRQIILQRARTAFEIVKHQYDSAKGVLNTLQDSMNFYRKQGLLSYDNQVKELTKGYADAMNKGSQENAKIMQDKLNILANYGKGFWDLVNALGDQYGWLAQVRHAYMEAKTNMDKVIPPFFVAEQAMIPDKRALPIRWIIVVISTFAAFFFGLIFLLISEKVKMKNLQFPQKKNQTDIFPNP